MITLNFHFAILPETTHLEIRQLSSNQDWNFKTYTLRPSLKYTFFLYSLGLSQTTLYKLICLSYLRFNRSNGRKLNFPLKVTHEHFKWKLIVMQTKSSISDILRARSGIQSTDSWRRIAIHSTQTRLIWSRVQTISSCCTSSAKISRNKSPQNPYRLFK